MSEKRVDQRDQKCVSQCIFDHWSEHSKTHPERRQESYTQCLTDCRICE